MAGGKIPASIGAVLVPPWCRSPRLFYGSPEIHHRHTREALVVRVSVLPARIAVQHVHEGTAVSTEVSTALIGRAGVVALQ